MVLSNLSLSCIGTQLYESSLTSSQCLRQYERGWFLDIMRILGHLCLIPKSIYLVRHPDFTLCIMLDHIISTILIQSDMREPFDLSNLHGRPGYHIQYPYTSVIYIVWIIFSQINNNKNNIFGFEYTFSWNLGLVFAIKLTKFREK